MNISYLIYQAERQRSVVEQRETDVMTAELAASIANAGRAAKAMVSRVAGNRQRTPIIPGDDLIPELSSRR